MLDAGLVQDVYLTTGTKEGGEPGTPFYDKPLQGREVVVRQDAAPAPDEGVRFEHSPHLDLVHATTGPLAYLPPALPAQPALPALLDQLDFEQLRPPLAGDEQAIAGAS